MSKSSQKYYDHQREFDRVNVAEMMHDIEAAEYLNTINDERDFKQNNRHDK